jgi:CubicO group peptidase (beta-lactamase class C family)
MLDGRGLWAMVVVAGLARAGGADAAGSQAGQIGACMQRAAAVLGFRGSVYARQGDVVVQRSFGAADAAGRIANTGATRFDIGSAGKMFTAIAIGRLVDRGMVRFDAPIGRYLPGLAPAFAGITIGQLLDHTSGLGDYLRPQNLAAIAVARTATDLLKLALAAPPAFAPGTRRAYSNSGYVVLGAVIERVAGESWAAFVQSDILDRAGMRDTRFDGVGGAAPVSRLPGAGLPARASPAGGMFSTAADLSRLLTALFGGRLVSPATLDVLLTPRPDPAGGPGVSGYGFLVRQAPRAKLGSGGGAPGVNADVAYFPGSGWQLVALANTDPPVATQMDRVLERAVFARDTAGACAAALADPAVLAAPMLLLPGRGVGGAEARG